MSQKVIANSVYTSRVGARYSKKKSPLPGGESGIVRKGANECWSYNYNYFMPTTTTIKPPLWNFE